MTQAYFYDRLKELGQSDFPSFSGWPLGFYSSQLYFSPKAQSQIVQPDLAAISVSPPLSAERRQLLEQFDATRLAQEQWNHRAHLEVAAAIYQLCGSHGWQAMTRGIERLNAAHGIPQTPQGGFHFSLTRFLYERVGLALAHPDWESSVAHLSQPDLILRFYRRATIASWQARTGWVPPDL